MCKFSQKRDRFENARPENLRISTKKIPRGIVDYSFQKDAFIGHRIEGNYLIAYMVEKVRKFQYLKEGEVMKKPENENAYIGIVVHSASDLHFIKTLIVKVTVIDVNRSEIGKQQYVYHPHPGLHNYGMNCMLPGDVYTLRVQVGAQNLTKQGSIEHNFTPRMVEVEFPHVMIQTGEH